MHLRRNNIKPSRKLSNFWQGILTTPAFKHMNLRVLKALTGKKYLKHMQNKIPQGLIGFFGTMGQLGV